jgi:hypothetical protein
MENEQTFKLQFPGWRSLLHAKAPASQRTMLNPCLLFDCLCALYLPGGVSFAAFIISLKQLHEADLLIGKFF